jgi:hypothetical protein
MIRSSWMAVGLLRPRLVLITNESYASDSFISVIFKQDRYYVISEALTPVLLNTVSLLEKSGFKYSVMRRKLQEAGGVITLNYATEIEPKFWGPTIIAPKI